jgi:TIR domain
VLMLMLPQALSDYPASRGDAGHRSDAVGGVFISYRGEDSHSYGPLIYSELSRRFGVDQVFLDSESTPAGEDFPTVLLGRLWQCSVLLVVIGPQWLAVTDAAGRRRIDSPGDWVRRELVEAFAHGLRVIPILTDDVQMPSEADLPTDIAALHSRQALRVHYATPVVILCAL